MALFGFGKKQPSADLQAAAEQELLSAREAARLVFGSNMEVLLRDASKLTGSILIPGYDYRAVNDMFLRGVLDGFMQGRPALPTDPRDRTTLHMAGYLAEREDIFFGDAIKRAQATESLYNQNEHIYDVILGAGVSAYREGGDRKLADAHERFCSHLQNGKEDPPEAEPLPHGGNIKLKADILQRVSIRQHAAIVGLLVERHVLITTNSVYVVNEKSPDIVSILHIDSGFLWIALAIRLGGDVPAAEDALREAVWRYAKLMGTDTGLNGTADIDLSVAEIMVETWRDNPDDWFASVISTSCRFMHPDATISPDGIGSIWQDAWRLYAGALSILGDATSRRVPGDSGDYREQP